MKASETSLLKVLQGSKVFLVPNFQRRYSWRKGEWEQLWDDLLRECRRQHSEDAQTLEGHFLGSVVLHPAPGGASVLMKHLVVDGQQRLTTALILIAALRDVGAALQLEGWNPNEYNDKYLVNMYDEDYPDRLVPTKLDRAAYVKTVRERIPTEGIGQAYTFFVKKIRGVVTSEDPSEQVPLKTIADTLLLHMLVVEINTTPGDSVNNIFNRLNSRGMQLSAADLVRNELLLNLSEAQAETAYEQYWMPMEAHLVKLKPRGDRDDRKFVTFLWAREVVFDPSTTRLNLFLTFERRYRDSLSDVPLSERASKALEIFEEIHADHELFLLMQEPMSPMYDEIPIGRSLRQALTRLHEWGSEPATPFALWVVKESATGGISEGEAVDAIDILLGYLIRRTLAGIPTNQLNRLLTPLANQLATRAAGKSVGARLREILGQHGYHWPSDAEVMGAVTRTPLYLSARGQVKFLLTEVERILEPLEHVDTASTTIEHVMPQSMPRVWTDNIIQAGAQLDDALSLLHTLGNLTLTAYNSQQSDHGFDDKKMLFANSPLRLNHQIAQMQTWLPLNIEDRSKRLAGFLIANLPGPPASRPDTDRTDPRADLVDKLEGALQTLPDGNWTSDEDLVAYLAADMAEVHDLVNGLGPEIARLVRTKIGGVPQWLEGELRDAVLQQYFEAKPGAHTSAAQLGKLERAADLFADGLDLDEVEGEEPQVGA